MTSNKHPKLHTTSDKDLREDPGIGASKGTYKAGDDEIEDGENMTEGDVGNDTDAAGGVNPNQTGRTNR